MAAVTSIYTLLTGIAFGFLDNEAGNRESNEYTLANCLIKSIVEAVGCNTFAFCTLVVFLEVEIFFIG